jgi:hypothetical protein
MKTLIIAALLLTTGCGGYSIKDDGLLGAPLGTMLYWGFGADKASSTGGYPRQQVDVNVYRWGGY